VSNKLRDLASSPFLLLPQPKAVPNENGFALAEEVVDQASILRRARHWKAFVAPDVDELPRFEGETEMMIFKTYFKRKRGDDS
jgi:hypothetical protein